MSETKKKTAAPKPVSKKPYLTGTPLDSSCIGGAMRFFLYLLMMAIAFLFLGAVLSFDSFTLRLIINLAVVLQRARVVGRICMDQMMVDVTDIPNVKAGDEVTLMGSDGVETITPDELGSWSDTIGYEVLLAATERVRRVWLHEHE